MIIRKIYILLLLLFVLQLTIAQNRATEIRDRLMNRDQSSVLVVAHRGDWRYAPENSLPAIENAIRMGVDIVELDVQRTKDGHIILMHDATLNRTTTGKGLVADWTLDSIRTLRLKNGINIRTKEIVPTLEEALYQTKGKILINLDKADRYFDEIYPLLKKTGTTKQVIMKGNKSAQEVKQQFGKYIEEVTYIPIVNLDNENSEEQINLFVQDMNPVAFELLYENDTNPLPLKIKDKLYGKSLIWYNTLWDTMAGGHDDDMSLEDPDKGYGYLIDTLGARILQTDRPGYLIEYLRSKNLHD
ncbi:glycerophosphodiester phosphodiesterase family protein [Proteiniphilum sp. X52]|uniref:glycerophosphodiester phosphodiesterase family protein n=1 Tax=Proteiniphilum sp. X52 TaxID=2382159 RepID=UPI000F09F170|nr:glycerophosphodiester phosphodiesterase family protein [Proteiniphilum sp. X52]RNC64816.1 glycerophosphodiester phosphodiesterase [Proteiniphilum sp. X52]